MKRLIACLTLLALLGACSGVPLRSLPRLMQMSGALLDTSPADVMVALQVDARMAPPASAVPLLVVKVTPREPGQFAPISLGVEQESLALAATDPTLAETRWETWLQMKKVDGFFEVWSGTLAQLKKSSTGK
jgi:hypothetical protein